MKKILLILLVAFTLSSCYTTFYPPEYMDMGNAESVPDSTRQVIINNYYETTEYYQVPYYRRYSLLWDDYYWDPFYYDYGYYHWRPYYWYGNYYYYNPHNHYWYYYDRYHNWDSGNWSGDGNSGGNADKGRIHKPGYKVLMNSPTGVAPFVSVGSDNNHITKPVGKVGVNVNSGITNGNNYTPKIQSVGKKPINGSSSSSSTVKSIKKTGSSYKPSSTSNNNKKSSSSSSYSTQKRNSSSSSSSSSSKSKSSSTSSSTSKNSSSESSTSKKSK